MWRLNTIQTESNTTAAGKAAECECVQEGKYSECCLNVCELYTKSCYPNTIQSI